MHLGSFRRLVRAITVRARRRPRLTLAAGVLAGVAVLAVGLVLGGAIRTPGDPSGQAATGPAFTYDATWSLLDLERHAEAGEVAAISAISGTGGRPDDLVARTRDGQLVRVSLSVDAGAAAAALATMGHGSLLTTEAWTAAADAAGPATPAADPLRLAMTWLIPIGLIVLLLVAVRRYTSARSARDGRAQFLTIMPPDTTTTSTSTTAPTASADGAAGLRAPVTLADVAGVDEAKLELTETIEFLRSPDRFRRLGARIPRGVLLYGPPGTGKTMLARAVAAEAGVPFIAASAAEFVEKYVGVGARRVRELFVQARAHGRAVVFIDEFDALAKTRGGANSHEEREQTLNQLLVELDGFTTTEEVVVIAATNRLDTIDPAVLRPGRFNRKIHVGLPDVAGRRAILAVHAADKPIATHVDLAAVARRTYGFSGAQLADLLNEAAILAARRGTDEIADEDIHAGWLKVAVGTSRRRSMDERERSIIAAHEVGHAICGRLHGDKRRIEEISLFAHGEALGVTVSSQEDNDLPAESDLRARLVALMGGRAAEELVFHEITGGAANDFEQANRIAVAMVTKWGMGRDPESIDLGSSGRGALSFIVARPNGSLPSEIQGAATRATRAILDEAYAEACRTLVEQMDLLRRLAAYLVEHERVDGETLEALIDGRIDVPTADLEWRALGSRPRAWADIAGYHDERRQSPRPIAVAAMSPAPSAVGAPDGRAALGTTVPGIAPSAPARPTRGLRLPRPTFRRRVRRLAAAAFDQAGSWLRADGEQPHA
jgi:cell division protease FtsH